MLTSPGDGGTRTVKVGDRVRIPRTPDFGGLKLNDWRGFLVPYGDDHTYLAVAPGTVEVEDTVYDTSRPCVPPQPIATFTLQIEPGSRPPLPAPAELGTSRADRTVTLVPGQELVLPTGWSASVSSDRHQTRVVDHHELHGTYAVRPGTARLVLTPKPRDPGLTVTVRVVDPETRSSRSAQDATSVRAPLPGRPVGGHGLLAAGLAAQPACG